MASEYFLGGIVNIPEPPPPRRTIVSELHLYLYLLESPTLRQSLLSGAGQVRTSLYEQIHLHHPYLSIPFILTITTTENDLFNMTNARFSHYLNYLHRSGQYYNEIHRLINHLDSIPLIPTPSDTLAFLNLEP